MALTESSKDVAKGKAISLTHKASWEGGLWVMAVRRTSRGSLCSRACFPAAPRKDGEKLLTPEHSGVRFRNVCRLKKVKTLVVL